MAQFFIVCTTLKLTQPDAMATAQERNAITEVFEKRGWNVWHWFEELWLVVNPKTPVKIATITRDIRKNLGKGRFFLITEVEPRSLAGFGPAPGWDWTNENWRGQWEDDERKPRFRLL